METVNVLFLIACAWLNHNVFVQNVPHNLLANFAVSCAAIAVL